MAAGTGDGAPRLEILCAGAVQGLVKALQDAFAAETGAVVSGHFEAVGAMKEALMAGAPCDLMIVSDAMIDTLSASRFIAMLAGEQHAALRRDGGFEAVGGSARQRTAL